jgi:RND family efflux transporter MFP subunit
MASFTKRARTLALPAAALGMLAFAISAVIHPERVRADPPQQPPAGKARNSIAAIGTIEPQSELISVATEIPGVVRRVSVRPGDRVGAGQPLFVLDTRAAEAALAAARADVASAQAALRSSQVALADERQRQGLFESIDDPAALSGDELARRRFGSQRAAAAVAQARAAVDAAQAVVRVRQTDLTRLTVAAPISGRVYRVNVRPGQFAPVNPENEPLLTMGADTMLHVRAEFDEADAARLRGGGRAYGVLRGAPGRRIPLSLVRIEPQVAEKRALSGGSERVDTRVVEVIYAFDPARVPAWLGQRMDVFVEGGRS